MWGSCSALQVVLTAVLQLCRLVGASAPGFSGQHVFLLIEIKKKQCTLISAWCIHFPANTLVQKLVRERYQQTYWD